MMLDATLEAQIAAIHAQPQQLVYEYAGAGSLALFCLHAVGGSSRTVIEANDRYAMASMSDLLQYQPESLVSRDTAIAMATKAYQRARYLSADTRPCLGLACTAAISTTRERRGANRAWVALHDGQTLTIYGLTLHKGARERLDEERVISSLVLYALARACGIAPGALDLLPDESVEEEQIAQPEPLAALLQGDCRSISVSPLGQRLCNPNFRGVILSGSFNPLHTGHEELAYATAQYLGLPWAFELSVVNADKPSLSYAEAERRLQQFSGNYTALLSCEPLFVGKAQCYPGSVFIVGYDTARRLIEARYYGDHAAMLRSFEQIRAAQCRFIVAGRLENDRFLTLDDLQVPDTLQDLFLKLPADLFRVDVSSTQVRAWRAAAQHFNTLSD
jgi:hypothetical protein